MLRPAEWLGMTAEGPDPSTGDIVWFRWALVLVAVACAAALARGRHATAAVVGGLFAVGAVGFWVVALGRPYGVLADDHVTRCAAELAVGVETGRWDEGPVAGETRERAWSDRLAARFSRGAVLLAPTWLPVLVLPLSACLLAACARGDALAAGLLWIAFGTGDLDSARGAGFVPGLWSRPGSAAAFLAALALLAFVSRVFPHPRVGLAAAAAVAATWVAAGFGGPRLDPFGTALLLTFDQGLWLWLAAWSLWKGRGRSGVPLLLAGGLLGVAGAAGLGADPWAVQAFFRAGVIVAAVPALREAAHALGAWLQSEGRLAWAAAPLGGAVLFALGAAGSTLAWWDPPRWDPVARQSLEPLSDAVGEPMDWLRRETPADAVVLAAPPYAPAVSILAGRRVLRAPSLAVPADDDRRRRLERAVLVGDTPPPPALLRRYGLRYVLAAPGDFQDLGVRAPHELALRPHLKLRHLSRAGFRVYEIVQ